MTLHQIKTHPTYVEGCFGCKAAGLRFGQVDASAQKAWDRELDEYRGARAQGIQPASTRTQDIREAVEMSNVFQDAYDATKPSEFAAKHTHIFEEV